MKRQMVDTFFTFGSAHTERTAIPLRSHVRVVAPEGTDARALFMAWLGSNKFSGEYADIPSFAPICIATIEVKEY